MVGVVETMGEDGDAGKDSLIVSFIDKDCIVLGVMFGVFVVYRRLLFWSFLMVMVADFRCVRSWLTSVRRFSLSVRITTSSFLKSRRLAMKRSWA